MYSEKLHERLQNLKAVPGRKGFLYMYKKIFKVLIHVKQKMLNNMFLMIFSISLCFSLKHNV